MKHFTKPGFWTSYNDLPDPVKKAADKSFRLLKSDPDHPSLRLKPVGRLWSARVSLEYRALAVKDGDNLIWFWIGHHNAYDRIIR